jgi:hypothetical protein
VLTSEVKCSWVKCSEGLSNRVPNIVTRYKDHTSMKFAAYMAVWFITFLAYSSGFILYHCMYGCMFCVLLFNFIKYIFLLLFILIVMFMCSYCYVCNILCIMFHCVVLCTVCV